MDLRFSWDDANQAAKQWGCNCGPSALAFVRGKTLAEIRPLVEQLGFATKRYMSPTMMVAALRAERVSFADRAPRGRKIPCEDLAKWQPELGLARIQWTGPWTAPGSNARWAYGYTHWIGVSKGTVFDINFGMETYDKWASTVPPMITRSIKRSDGGWFATHLLELA